MNMDNYITCHLCKNIFLKTHVRFHYENCKNKNNKALTVFPDKNINNINNKSYNTNNTNKINNLNKTNNSNYYINNTMNLSEHSKDKELFSGTLVKENTERKYSNLSISKENKEEHKENEIKRDKKNIDSNELYNINKKDNSFQIERYIKPDLVSYNDNVLNHFFKEYNKLFSEYVRDKCIALVGPAESIIGTNKGEIIDKFDLVVRLNKSIPVPSKLHADIGKKTDIIYNSLNVSDFPGENNLNPRLYKKYGVNFICSSYPFNHNIFHDDIANYVYKYKFELPLKVMEDLKFRNFEKMLGTRPYTGTCAIMDLLSYPIRYLYITGLDFYQTKYYNEYRIMSKSNQRHTKNNTIHKAKPQLEYLKNLSLIDDRIILDGFLDKLLYNDYYKVFKQLKSFEQDKIFGYGDVYLQKYFELKHSECTFTKSNNNPNKANSNVPYLVITDNKYYNKTNNEYCLFLTNDKNQLSYLNMSYDIKKFIGNFFYVKNNINLASIYVSDKFLLHLKVHLVSIGIHNCNINIAIMLSIMLYLPDKHYFSNYEIFNSWKISTEEKRFVLFLIKKKLLKVI
jgi:hypothetical protein